MEMPNLCGFDGAAIFLSATHCGGRASSFGFDAGLIELLFVCLSHTVVDGQARFDLMRV